MAGGFLHHFQMRKRVHKELQQYPHPNKWMRFLDRLIVVGAAVVPFSNIPQILAIYSMKSAGSLSLITWVAFAALNSLWIVYGLVHKEKLIAFASALAVCFHIPIIIGIIIYS